MRIVVLNIAASKTGAKTVLRDFSEFVRDLSDENEWVFITGVGNIIPFAKELKSSGELTGKAGIYCILRSDVKSSWAQRLKFELLSGAGFIRSLKPDIVFSMENTLPRGDLGARNVLYVHQPMGDFVGAWKDMEKAVRAGKVRALGISNFDANDSVFTRIIKNCEIRPVALQIECHPYAQRLDIRKKAAEYGLQVECWFPLGGSMSQGALLKDPVIVGIADRLKKTPAQVILRWHMQEGLSVIPGSKTPAHIMENINIFDFALSSGDMDAIRALNKEQRFFNMDYKQAEQFMVNWKIED